MRGQSTWPTASLWGPCSTPPSTGVSPATVTATLVSGETVRVRARSGTDTRDASDSRQLPVLSVGFFFFFLFFNGAAGTRSQTARPKEPAISPRSQACPSWSFPARKWLELKGPTQDTEVQPILVFKILPGWAHLTQTRAGGGVGVGVGRENRTPLLSETAFQCQGPPRSGVSAPVCSSSLGSPALATLHLPGPDNSQANSTGISHHPHTGKVS